MRSEGRRRHLAVPVPQPPGLQRLRIEGVRRTILLHGEQTAVVKYDVGVRYRALHAPDAWIVGIRVAVVAEKATSGRALRFEAMGAHVPVLHVDVAVLEPERRDDAIAIERIGVAHPGRKLLVRAYPIEGPVQLRGISPSTSRSNSSPSNLNGSSMVMNVGVCGNGFVTMRLQKS